MINEQMKAEIKAEIKANPDKWDIYAKDELSVNYRKLESCNFSSTKATYKLILKEHSPIAQAVIENPDIIVYWQSETQPTHGWINEEFFKWYNPDHVYKIVDKKGYTTAQPKPDVNALQINSMEDLNDLPIVKEQKQPSDFYLPRIEKAIEYVCDPRNIKPEDTISITDESGKVYEFVKPEFECELLKVYLVDKSIVGTIKIKNGLHIVKWNLNGKIIDGYGHKNLTPIKSKWYEDESNFPALIVYDDTITTAQSFQKENQCFFDEEYQAIVNIKDCRLATKAERDSLYCGKGVNHGKCKTNYV